MIWARAIILGGLVFSAVSCAPESIEDRLQREVFQACLDRLEADYGGLIPPREARDMCEEAIND